MGIPAACSLHYRTTKLLTPELECSQLAYITGV
jgi:hypothetical protein